LAAARNVWSGPTVSTTELIPSLTRKPAPLWCK
jgi:hypothetical protein